VAMTMIGEVQLPASRGAVWAMLNEPAMLKAAFRVASRSTRTRTAISGRSPRGRRTYP
jgi:carbon monoxide dehydrogenase subunit G